MNNMNRKSVLGSLVFDNPLIINEGNIILPGYFRNNHVSLKINEDIMSKHLLFVGGTGSGKTNAIYHIINQVKSKLENDDIMIIFDTKGDYYNLFYDKQDFVIGNSKEYRNKSEKWNLFREILADGWDSQEIENNIQEISWSIFREAIDNSKDPFFPNAARDLFAGILLCMLESGKNNVEYKRKNYYNSVLKVTLDRANAVNIKTFIEGHPKYASVTSYLGDAKNGQSLGVYAEMISNVRKILTGVFADKGSFSIRDFVRKRNGKTLFIEYDLSMGNSLTPIYSLLIDLALKESLGRSEKKGNVYIICDEFSLLPYLQHIEDGVNFGRSLGVKIIAGIQSVNQMTESYGEYRGKNILAGFSSVFSFRVNDYDSRKYVTDIYGENVVIEQRKTLGNVVTEEQKNAKVVEDWDIRNLNLGEAIIGFPFKEPFIFQFDLFNNLF